jgi:hypothetical protein
VGIFAVEIQASLGFPKHEGRGDFAVTPFSQE